MLSYVISAPAYAAEWLTEPTITLGSTYNDNITFRTADEIDATSSTLSARLNSQIKEQIWGMNVDAQVRTRQTQNKAGNDTNNIFFKFGSNYRTELHSWNFDANFERNTTFDEDFDTQLSANGVLDAQTQREVISLSPVWGWSISESWLLQTSLQLTDTKYDEVNLAYLSGSASNSLQLLARHQINDVSDVSVSGGYSETERDQNRINSSLYNYENTNYQLSYKYKTSEASTFSMGLGERKTVTNGTNIPACTLAVPVSLCTFFGGTIGSGGTTNTSNSGNTFDISYNYQHEISSYSIALMQSVTTTSDGFAQEFNNYTIKYNRKLSEKVSFALILNASESASIDSVSTIPDREILRIEPSVSWRFSKDNRLRVGYRYRRQTYLRPDIESASNSIYINLSFFWPKLMSSY